MKIKISGLWMFITEHAPTELEWVKNKLTWYNRSDKSIKNAEIGDLVQATYGKLRGKIGVIAEVRKDKIAVLFKNGKTEWLMPYHLTEMQKDTLLYQNSEGRYYTYHGVYSLLKRENPKFPFDLINPPSISPTRWNTPVDILRDITLERFQCEAVNKALMLKKGLEVLPTSSGKGEIILAINRMLLNEGILNKAIITVPSILQADQLVARAKVRGFTNSEIGAVHSDSKQYEAKVVVSVVNSLAEGIRNKDPNVLELLQSVDTYTTDESHHLRSNTMMSLMMRVQQAERNLGFSGSPFLMEKPLDDIGDTIIWGVTGGPIYTVPHEYIRKIGLAAEPVIFMKKIGSLMLKSNQRYQTVYDKFVVENEERNDWVIKYARRFVKFGFQVLILVQRLSHAEMLMKELSDLRVVAVFGGRVGRKIDPETKEVIDCKIDYSRVRDELEAKKWDIAIGSSVADEGWDVPSFGAAINASGGKSRIKTLQRLGRPLRKKKIGPNVMYFLDFDDRTHVYLASHSRKRRELFQEVRATIIEEEEVFNNKIAAHGKLLLNKGEHNV